MNSKKKHSSRSRMENRAKKRSRPSPVVLTGKDGEFDANRAARKQRIYFLTHAQGLSAVQAQREKRKENQKASRRALRVMRNETKKAQRAAAGA